MVSELLLIPSPQKITFGNGFLDISDFTHLFTNHNVGTCVTAKLEEDFSAFKILSAKSKYFFLSTEKKPELTKPPARAESYNLYIATSGLSIVSVSEIGLFYGIVTLLQLSQNYQNKIPYCEISDWPSTAMRSEYLDFRSIFPKHENLLKYIKEMANYKLNTLFIEYEDKLPFKKELAFINHPTQTLTKQQHLEILQTAEDNFVQVIPKQQCFGHLEYILKHPQYVHLREGKTAIAELCPENPESFNMITSILDNVMALHPRSTYIHLGCDEVWSLGDCGVCKATKDSKATIFIRFVNKLAEFVLSKGKIPLIWHDALTSATKEELALINKKAIVCVWTYSGAYAKTAAEEVIHLLKGSNITTFGAPSVKCWDGDGEQNFPNLQNRIRNISEWADLAKQYQLNCLIHTNWAVPFALGSCYGIFETSRYPAFFAADLSWNYGANKNTFLNRFLCQYHGIFDNFPYDITDYFEIAKEIHEKSSKNIELIEWIVLLNEYELYYKKKFPIQTYMARSDETHFSAEIKLSLIEKAKTAKKELSAIRTNMRTILLYFLEEDMADFYIKTRFYLFDLYLKNLNEIYNCEV